MRFMSGGAGGVRGRLGLALVLGALAASCGPSYVEVRPSEPLAGAAGGVHADVTRLWLSEDVRSRGLAEDADLVVELRVRNDDARERKISPGALSCWMELDARRPGETRSLLPGGGGAGEFPGEPPDEGSLLAAVTIPAGQSRLVWAIFHGYRFEGSDRPRRITLKIPLDDGALALDLADPARGALRWEAPPARGAVTIGVRNLSLFGGALHATVPSTEIVYASRRGPLLWDLGPRLCRARAIAGAFALVDVVVRRDGFSSRRTSRLPSSAGARPRTRGSWACSWAARRRSSSRSSRPPPRTRPT